MQKNTYEIIQQSKAHSTRSQGLSSCTRDFSVSWNNHRIVIFRSITVYALAIDNYFARCGCRKEYILEQLYSISRNQFNYRKPQPKGSPTAATAMQLISYSQHTDPNNLNTRRQQHALLYRTGFGFRLSATITSQRDSSVSEFPS